MTRWFRLSTFAPLVAYQVPDASAGGGGADPGSTGGDSPSPDDSAATDQPLDESASAGDAGESVDDPHAAGQEETLEDLLIDDMDQGARPLPEQVQALRAANKKLKKRLAREASFKQQFGEANPQEVLKFASIGRELQQLYRDGNQKEIARIFGLDTPPARASEPLPPGVSPRLGGAPASGVDEGDLIDLSKLQIDPTDSPINQAFIEVVKTANELKREIRALKADAQSQAERRESATAAQREQGWVSASQAAAAKIGDPGVRTLFQDQMTSAYKAGAWKKFSAEYIANHYLTLLKVTPGTRQAVNDAMRARTAKNTAQLPRQHVGAGRPATAQGNQKKTFASIREKFDMVDE